MMSRNDIVFVFLVFAGMLLSGQQQIAEPLPINRKDVASLTPWLVPIIWEGIFDSTLVDFSYKQQNITIATTVFALGKYTRFLKDFLESAEQHYFVGFRVHYYLFTDQPEAVPDVKLSKEHHLTVRTVPSMDRWQDISMGRMGILEKLTESELDNKTDHIFCLDVDAKFYGRWGVESLGCLVGVIHPWFYNYPREKFTYERRPESQASSRLGKGIIITPVLRLVAQCRKCISSPKPAVNE